MFTKPQPVFRAFLIASILGMAAAQGLNAQDVVTVPCDSNNVGGTYCYVDNAEHTWLWQSDCGEPIILQFTSGVIESYTYDQLTIYDGVDSNTPVVWSNASTSPSVDLTGLQFVGTSGYLFMELAANATNCCATNGLLAEDGDWVWEWTCSVASGTVSVGEAPPSNFSMYPNPATDQLTLRLPSKMTGAVELRILNTLGREVLVDHFASTGEEVRSLDVRRLPSGSYCVVFTTPKGVMTRRLQILN